MQKNREKFILPILKIQLSDFFVEIDFFSQIIKD